MSELAAISVATFRTPQDGDPESITTDAAIDSNAGIIASGFAPEPVIGPAQVGRTRWVRRGMTERAMTHAASLAWLAHHEFRLAWRDWWSMLTAGKPHRARVVAIAMLAFAAFMHLVAFAIVAKFAAIDPDADRGTLVVITGCALLAWSLMMSQAMESVTRAFYARSDLDLILSSPVVARRRVRGADRDDGGLDRVHGGAAGGAVHQHPGLSRRRCAGFPPMAWWSRSAPRRRRCRSR